MNPNIENENFLNLVTEWNDAKGLSKLEYKPEFNAKNIIEESLEILGCESDEDRQFYSQAWINSVRKPSRNNIRINLDNACEFIDGNVDAAIYAIGDIYKIIEKLGIKQPGQAALVINRLFTIVMRTNMEKTGKINEFNKLEKGENFVPPEARMKMFLKKVIETGTIDE